MSSEILQCLEASLNADPNIRISAELRISELFASPETSTSLANVVLSQDINVSLRQIRILLRKYVKERWSPYFASFKGNAPSLEIKSQVRVSLFQGLSDPQRKIRSACAHALSLIANCDWPDEYPDLLESLITLLSSSSLESVHGSMQVFDEFIKSDLSEDQILSVLRKLLPVLLDILGSTQHGPVTRARAVSVFRQCVTTLFMVKEQHPQSVKEAINSILPVWINAFETLLNIPPQQDVQGVESWDKLAIRIEIFKTLDTIHMGFPKSLTPHISTFLSLALGHLRDLLPTFIHYYLSSSSDSPPSASEEEPIQLNMLGCPIIDFTSSLSRGSKAKGWWNETNVESLIISLSGWMQMTEDDEDSWGNDANAFVAHEDDEMQSYSLRVAGLDLLSILIEREPAITTKALSQAIARIVSESQQARGSGNTDWWRPLEASLAALGSMSEAIVDFCDDEEQSGRPKPIDLEQLLANVIPQLLLLSDYPFLQGRSFVFASQYAKTLPSRLAGQYMSAAIDVLEAENAGVPIKISAVKAIQNFASGMEDSVLVPIAPRIAKDLGPFLLVTSEDTLSLVLETFSSVLDVDKGAWITPDLSEPLVSAILQVWEKNNKDPIFISILAEILTTLANSSHPGVYETVVKVALPNLCNAISNTTQEQSWIAGSAIELITSIESGASNGLGAGFFATLAPSLFHCLKTFEDRDVLQGGIICLTWVIRKDCGQLLSWHDVNGQSGIDNVFVVIAKLLNNESESGGLVIGDLIIHLLRRVGSAIVSVLPELLQAMVKRMVTAKTATFVQSLVIPFAFLVQSDRDSVLSLLEKIDVNGRSGIDVLIQTWCENAEVFQGFWPSRVSTLGLCQLFTSERQSLRTLLVKGDIIVKPETRDVIVTRSRAKMTPHEFTQIPFHVKALKLIVNDLRSSGESAGLSSAKGHIDADSDDEDEEWQDEDAADPVFGKDELAFLSDMLGPRAGAFDDSDIPDDTDDDEDLKNDPISQMDMTAHLISFLKESAARNVNGFVDLVGHLNAEEMLVIQSVLSPK